MLYSLTFEAISAVVLAVMVILAVGCFIVFVLRYKKCPSDKILVVYGKLGKDKNGKVKSYKCFHGGAVFVPPFVCSYSFLDLKPLSIVLPPNKAKSRDGMSVFLYASFTVAISTNPRVMQIAAQHLLFLPQAKIQAKAKEIILGQWNAATASLNNEQINAHDILIKTVSTMVNGELSKMGLFLINIHITDEPLEMEHTNEKIGELL